MQPQHILFGQICLEGQEATLTQEQLAWLRVLDI